MKRKKSKKPNYKRVGRLQKKKKRVFECEFGFRGIVKNQKFVKISHKIIRVCVQTKMRRAKVSDEHTQ